MPNKKIKGGRAPTPRRYIPGADAPANVVPGGQTPQGMTNSITAGPAPNFPEANFRRGGSRSTRKGGRRHGGRRSTRKGRRCSTRKGGRRSLKKGGGVLATAALPFGLFGLQRLFGKKFTRKLRNMF
jgi:hypothetical protein